MKHKGGMKGGQWMKHKSRRLDGAMDETQGTNEGARGGNG